MSTSSLLEVMTEEVARQRASILASSQAEAERILAQAREDAARRKAKALEAADAELAEAAARARERTEAEAHMIVLTTKDTITDEILAAVAKELRHIVTTPEFPAIVEAMLEELLANTKGGEVVLAPPEYVEHCRTWLAEHGHADIEAKALNTLRDGVAIQDARRSFRVTNTFSARLAKQESRLRKLCLERLLPETAGPATGAS